MPLIFSRVPRTIYLDRTKRPIFYKTQVQVSDADWQRFATIAGTGPNQIENLDETHRHAQAAQEEQDAHAKAQKPTGTATAFQSRVQRLLEAQTKENIARAASRREPKPEAVAFHGTKSHAVQEPGMEGTAPQLSETGEVKVKTLIREQRRIRDREITMTDLLSARVDKLKRLITGSGDLELLKQYQIRIPSSKRRPEVTELLERRITELAQPS